MDEKYEVIFKGSFITSDSKGFIEKLNTVLEENNIKYQGKILVFPIEGYTEYEDVTETSDNHNEKKNNCDEKENNCDEEKEHPDTDLQS